MRALTLTSKILGSVWALSFFIGCSGGSGQDNEVTIQPPIEDGGGGGLVYNGPQPSSDDIQNFKLNVWDNLAEDNRCGSCHGADGDGTPAFAHADDINIAYAEANSVVDESALVLSRLVTKVAEGHNCWQPEASVCADIITNYLEAWKAASGVEPEEIVLEEPPERDVGSSKSFPADTFDFEQTIYPLLTQYCANCHSEDSATKQQPFFASNDIDIAYQAARNKINLDDAVRSRLVLRLGSEFHNCWSNCTSDANDMTAQIELFSGRILPTVVDPNLVVSRATSLPDGTIASSGGRIESNVIALYEFKNGGGSTAFDTSGVEPGLNLTLTDDVEWVGSWGIRINDGKAQGSTDASRKLYNLIRATGEYSIEAWVVPDNVAQDGPARIVTYSGGDETRNFTLGQTLYDYNFLARSSDSDANGMPMISTPSAQELLQATLQHVVVNFDPINGRSIYVNGELVAENTAQPGNLNEWDPTFALAIGSEVDGDNLWMGTMRLLAIHNRVLSAEDILKNFDAGVGEKFFLLFGVSHLIDMPQAYVVFEVQQFDNYAYLFNVPYFISLDDQATLPAGLTLEGLRIGINGKEAAGGQTYANLNMSITTDNYSATSGTPLATMGALIPLDKGQDDDLFFITFDRIGSETFDRPVPIVPDPPEVAPAEEQSDIGVRIFGEVNASLSSITGVPETNSMAAEAYALVRQQMPTVEAADGFLSSHQSGVMQLSVAYCTALVNNTTYRDAFFDEFENFGQSNATSAFAGEGKNQIIDPLIKGLLAHEVDLGTSQATMTSQPNAGEIRTELDSLIDLMSSSDTTTVVIATCAAALGSAVMLVQ